MILTCPSCSAKYNVSDESLGGSGRDVRCAKCGHMWHEKSAKDSLTDLISRIQSEEMDEILFGNQRDLLTKEEKPKRKRRSFSFKLSLPKFFTKNKATERQAIAKTSFFKDIRTAKGFAGFMVGLAVFMVALYGVVITRTSISHALPPVTKVFDNLGFYIPKPGRPNAEKTLGFDRLALGEEQGNRVITGLIVNLVSYDVTVPTMRFSFIDSHGKAIDSVDYNPPRSNLAKEDTMPLHFPMAKDIPDATAKIQLSFVTKN